MTLAVARRDHALEARLALAVQTARLGHPLYAYACVTSTMDLAKDLVEQGCQEGTMVFAQRQTQGRGRLGRAWNSPIGGLYLSMVLRPQRAVSEAPQLALVAGLAVAETVRTFSGLFPTIRWPNDVLLDDRKVAGILVEAKSNVVILGIGINATTSVDQLSHGATSLITAGASPEVDPDHVVGHLCHRVETWYDEWVSRGFGKIREALRPWMGLFGQPVHISAGSEHFEGTASDLDEAGRLLVRLDSGIVRAFEMGEVSLLR